MTSGSASTECKPTDSIPPLQEFEVPDSYYRLREWSRHDIKSYSEPHFHSMTSLMNLDNPILPLLEKDNWLIPDDTNPEDHEQFYKVLDTVCRLASRFIQTPALQPWWVHTMVAKPVVDPLTGIAVLKQPEGNDKARRTAMNRLLTGDIKSLRIQFWICETHNAQSREAWGTTQLENRVITDSKGERRKRIRRIPITFHRYLYDFAVSQYEKLPLFVQQAYIVGFAKTLLHELAHAVHARFHFAENRTGQISNEALHNEKEQLPEMGYSWESWLPGGASPKYLNFESSGLGRNIQWFHKEPSGERDKWGALQINDPRDNTGMAPFIFGGSANMQKFLSLLDNATWTEIEVQGLKRFHQGLLLPCRVERFQVLEKEISYREASNTGRIPIPPIPRNE
ncbi:hypothetical protein EJ08DRAFT_732043 [Tothia fuscella]|uniref:Uncharacterized protein n=1 Tax=Tothia fuscella TaxID=1048955 RepID=A0A9P4TZX6_9PEZI|nr:hypothetical protein EJ08DRAFT_732043 [Tothia fuscella]